MRSFGWVALVILCCLPTARAAALSPSQRQVLNSALRIGHELHLGSRLAAVAYQESSLGRYPVSAGHYGVGSCSWTVWHWAVTRHPWLGRYFRHRNWATVLVRNPTLSLWVSGYWLRHCWHRARTWTGAYSLYRYGTLHPQGPYPRRVACRLRAIRRLRATLF